MRIRLLIAAMAVAVLGVIATPAVAQAKPKGTAEEGEQGDHLPGECPECDSARAGAPARAPQSCFKGRFDYLRGGTRLKSVETARGAIRTIR